MTGWQTRHQRRVRIRPELQRDKKNRGVCDDDQPPDSRRESSPEAVLRRFFEATLTEPVIGTEASVAGSREKGSSVSNRDVQARERGRDRSVRVLEAEAVEQAGAKLLFAWPPAPHSSRRRSAASEPQPGEGLVAAPQEPLKCRVSLNRLCPPAPPRS